MFRFRSGLTLNLVLAASAVVCTAAGLLSACCDKECGCPNLSPAPGIGGEWAASGGTGILGLTGGGGATGGGSAIGGSVGTGGAASEKWGTINFIAKDSVPSLTVSVTFSDAPRIVDPACQTTTAAECTLRTCPISDTPDPVNQPDSGLIQVTSGLLNGHAWFEPDLQGMYSTTDVTFSHPDHRDQLVYYFSDGGEPLTFMTSGGEVPSFTVEAIFPPALSIVQPPSVEGLITAPRTQPLTLTLSGGGLGDELTVFGSTEDPVTGLETSLTCYFPLSTPPLPLTIPVELLATLPASYRLIMYRTHRYVVTAGEYVVTLRLLGEVKGSDAKPASIVVP